MSEWTGTEMGLVFFRRIVCGEGISVSEGYDAGFAICLVYGVVLLGSALRILLVLGHALEIQLHLGLPETSMCLHQLGPEGVGGLVHVSKLLLCIPKLLLK